MTTTTRLRATAGLLAAGAALTAGTARGDSTPVGPLPKPAVTTVATTKGSLVSLTVQSHKPSTGLVWRVARPFDTRVVRQVGEADVGPAVVLVFRVVGRGKASITLALTHGDASSKALQAARYDIRAT